MVHMHEQGGTEQLDEHDVPLSLTAAQVAAMTPVQLWRVLKKHGWQYKRGKDLVDWYYIRPGRDITAGNARLRSNACVHFVTAGS
jgi:hypothetical protein